MTGREIVFIAGLAVVGTGLWFHFRGGPSGETRAPVDGREETQDVTPDSAPDNDVDYGHDELFDRLPGLYIQLADEGRIETGHLLFITADLELYKLARSQVKYVREYVGSIDPDMLKLSPDGSFSFYDYFARRPGDGEDIPMLSQLSTLLKVNDLAKTLLKELNRRNLELSVRLDRDRPQFTEVQIALMEILIQKPDDLAVFMAEQGLETLWINDYLNDRLYRLDGNLVIPAAMKESAEKIAAKIADRSYELEDMDQ